MAKTKTEILAEVHDECMREFNRVQAALRNERLQCLQDRRFYSLAGAQWEGPLGEQFENLPKLEFNKVHLSVIRVINEYRANRITVDYTPKDGRTDDELADTCDGLFRADERDSGAQEAYDNAFEEGVGGGFGAARLRTEYEDDEDDDNDQQRIRIEPIFDADSCVFFDLDAKRQDKADAKRAWVLTGMTPEAFKDEFGHDPSTWPKSVHQHEFDWAAPAMVYVAEYYRVIERKELLRIFTGLDGSTQRIPDLELKDDEDRLETLRATGYRETSQRKVTRKRVQKYIVSGMKVEEECGIIAGNCIPVVPFYGKRWVVDGVERCMGHVRLAKDAQRLMNSLLSWLTQIAARFDVEKPILSPEQIAGHAQMWAEDNVKRYPYLLANMVQDANGDPIPGSQAPTAYTKAPNVPPAMAALIQIASQSLEDLTGAQQAGEQMQPAISGRAVELIQARLDMQVFIYMDNFAKTVRRIGEVWLGMAREVYIEDERQMRTVTADGSTDTTVLRRPVINEETGEVEHENDLTKARYDVWVDVGPNSSSRRAATVRALTGVAQVTQDPEMLAVLSNAIMMNLEGEGLQDLRDYSRKQLVKRGVVKPTDEEAKELAEEAQGQGPDPQAQYLQAAAEQASADAALGRAKTVQTIADAALKQAQRDKTVAETHGEVHAQALRTFGALQDAAMPSPVPQGMPSMPGA